MSEREYNSLKTNQQFDVMLETMSEKWLSTKVEYVHAWGEKMDFCGIETIK